MLKDISNTIHKYMNFEQKKKTKNVNRNDSSYFGISSRKDLEELFPSIEVYILLYMRY